MLSWQVPGARKGSQVICLAGTILVSKVLMQEEMGDSPICLLLTHLVGIAALEFLRTNSNGTLSIRRTSYSNSGSPLQVNWAWLLVMVLVDSACLISTYEVLRFFGSVSGAVRPAMKPS